MFVTMLVLAVPCCFIEYKLTAGRPAVRKFLGEHKILALVFSTAISFIFGSIFGAEGLIVFGAGMISTMIMVVIYGVQPAIEANKSTISGSAKGIAMLFKAMLFIILIPFKVLAFFVHVLVDD